MYGQMKKGKVVTTRLSSSTLRARYSYVYSESFASHGACGGENSSEGGVYRQRGVNRHVELEYLEYTTSTPSRSCDVDREGGVRDQPRPREMGEVHKGKKAC